MKYTTLSTKSTHDQLYKEYLKGNSDVNSQITPALRKVFDRRQSAEARAAAKNKRIAKANKIRAKAKK